MKNDQSALTRLLDEAAIRTLIARFAGAAISADYDAFRTCWAGDGDWTIPQPFAAHATGTEKIVEMLKAIRSGKEFFVQFAVPGVIEINGDTATVRCVVHESARGKGGVYYRNHGLFHDHLRRSEDGWVFTSRVYQYLWLDTNPFAGDVFPLAPSDTP